MEIREIRAKTLLNKSKIMDYCVNPYTGCGHGCSYCYAQLIVRKFRPGGKWGSFVDVKINAPELLEKEITRAKKGTVWFSSVTDPYQPLEKKYELTRKCLEILLRHDFPVSILTRSPLVTRDIDLLKKFRKCEVGVTITTDNDNVKNLFEPLTPPFKTRVETLKALHQAGLKTYAFIGPLLPMDAHIVAESVAPYVDYVYIDKANYPHLWRKIAEDNNLSMDDEFFSKTRDELVSVLKKKVKINALF